MYPTDEIFITAKMAFESRVANEDDNFENFAVYTHLRVLQLEDEPGYVSGLTEFHSNNTGQDFLLVTNKASLNHLVKSPKMTFNGLKCS